MDHNFSLKRRKIAVQPRKVLILKIIFPICLEPHPKFPCFQILQQNNQEHFPLHVQGSHILYTTTVFQFQSSSPPGIFVVVYVHFTKNNQFFQFVSSFLGLLHSPPTANLSSQLYQVEMKGRVVYFLQTVWLILHSPPRCMKTQMQVPSFQVHLSFYITEKQPYENY